MGCSGFLVQPRMVVAAKQSNGSSSFPPRQLALGSRKTTTVVVKAAGELSSGSTTYLIAGAAVVALVGTAFPILFSRKDTCPECDGAGFVREAGGVLRANAARKDLPQIVCKNCNGLGKLRQNDEAFGRMMRRLVLTGSLATPWRRLTPTDKITWRCLVEDQTDGTSRGNLVLPNIGGICFLQCRILSQL
ncbi:hypothetical protein V2J09_004328 [Rumex salicifolius]